MLWVPGLCLGQEDLNDQDEVLRERLSNADFSSLPWSEVLGMRHATLKKPMKEGPLVTL